MSRVLHSTKCNKVNSILLKCSNTCSMCNSHIIALYNYNTLSKYVIEKHLIWKGAYHLGKWGKIK